MNMKNIFKSIAIAAALVSTAACTMDLYPNTAITYDPTKNLIQTEDDAVMYRMGDYAMFRSTIGAGDIADDLMCDAFNATRSYGNNYGSIHRADASFTSSDSDVESFWGAAFMRINNYNINIEAASKIQPEEDIYDACQLLIAEAKFFRAYTYLRLARRFAPAYDPATAGTDLCVPLVLKYDQNARPARATVQAIYDAIYADLTACDAACEEGFLPDVNPVNEKAYVTEDAITALWAMYYLDTQDYPNAFAKASSLCKGNDLCNTKADLLKEYTEDAGKEAIMMLNVNLDAGEGPGVSYSIYTGYDKDAASPKGESYKALYLPSQKLISSYDATDIRLSCWFDDCKTVPYAGEGSFSEGKFYVFTKYKGNLALSSTEYPKGTVAPVAFKLGHMYLIAAEAAAQNNDPVNTLKYLNALRNARGAKAATTPSLAEVQKEWFRETVGDGCRIECLKRWGLGCDVRTAQPGAIEENVVMKGAGFDERVLSADDYHFTWPVPSYEMKVNPNLVQNAGYSSAE